MVGSCTIVKPHSAFHNTNCFITALQKNACSRLYTIAKYPLISQKRLLLTGRAFWQQS